MAKYLDETGLAHFWGNIKSEIDEKVEPYVLHQSDFHNDIIQPVIANVFPAAPTGTIMQGMCIDSSGNVYVAYRANTAAHSVLRKYTGTIGDGSTLTTANELTLSHAHHMNSINLSFDGSKLLIARITAEDAGYIDVVDVGTFTEDSAYQLPYAGLNNVACSYAFDGCYLVGRFNDGGFLQMFHVNADLSRKNSHFDCYIKTPCETNFSQGCCVGTYPIFYELHSYSPEYVSRAYVLAFDLNDNGQPVVFPIGTPQNLEIEDISIYNGHMYANQNTYLYDLGSGIVSSYNQYSAGNWWKPISPNKIGRSLASYFDGDTHTTKFPKTIHVPAGFREIWLREPERCEFRFSIQEYGHHFMASPWYKLSLGYDYYLPFIYGSVWGFWNLMLANTFPDTGIITVEALSRVQWDSSNVRSDLGYPNFEISAYEIEFRVLPKS